MRNIVILVLIMIALAMVRWLVMDVVGAVKKTLRSSDSENDHGSDGGPRDHKRSETHTGHMVRDPISGTYIDERFAIKETVDGRTVYFESKENRDTYLRKGRSG